MMRILAIDPGNVQSAFVAFDAEHGDVTSAGIQENRLLLEQIRIASSDRLAIEFVACYGMSVGRTVFDTCCWIGRFIEAFDGPYNKVMRKSRWGPGPEQYGSEGIYEGECMHLCKINRAKDTNIRQALIDRFGPGKEAAVGVKAKKGPLYGFRKDMWAALSVAVTFADQYEALRKDNNLQAGDIGRGAI